MATTTCPHLFGFRRRGRPGGGPSRYLRGEPAPDRGLGGDRPLFHYSDTWQLIINTGTTIVTFLMVFLIQNTQNRDGAAIQAKLDELIRASAAQNAYIGIEHLTEEELDSLRARCEARAKNFHLGDAADAAEEAANAKAAAAARAATGA